MFPTQIRTRDHVSEKNFSSREDALCNRQGTVSQQWNGFTVPVEFRSHTSKMPLIYSIGWQWVWTQWWPIIYNNTYIMSSPPASTLGACSRQAGRTRSSYLLVVSGVSTLLVHWKGKPKRARGGWGWCGAGEKFSFCHGLLYTPV